MRIAFLGDINGAPGRQIVSQQLPVLRERWQPDVIIANAENAKAGSGLSPDLYRQFRALGIDACTLGDHAFRDAKIIPILEDPNEPVARPANLSRRAPGKKFVRIRSGDRAVNGGSVGAGSEVSNAAARNLPDVWVITVLGRIFMPLPADDPFAAIDLFLETLPVAPPNRAIVIVEAHMEATSEKAALARYLDGRVTAVLGTHTHVPTADARILRGGTAFISDVGMCGPYDSVIGRDPEQVLKAMTTSVHVPFEMGTGGEALCGAVIDVHETNGLARSIERIELPADRSRSPFRPS